MKAAFVALGFAALALPVKYSVTAIRLYGISSPLTYNVTLLRSAFRQGFQRDVSGLEALSDRLEHRPEFVYNENVTKPGGLTPADLQQSENPIRDAAGDTFQTIKGEADATNSAVGDHPSPDSRLELGDDQEPRSDWTMPAGGDSAQRYSHFQQINTGNVKNLKLIHVVDAQAAFNGEWLSNSESAPLNWRSFVYWISADERLIAANIETGKIAWQQKVPSFGYSRRGFILDDRDFNGRGTLFVPMGHFIVALDAETGKLVPAVARDGVITLNGETVISPLPWNGQLIVALYNSDVIVGIDLKSGATQWSTPLHDAGRNFLGGAPWGGMAIDRRHSVLFVTTGNPRPALLGITRPGDNKNSDSVIAIDLNRKVIKWAFQEVRHDLWDLDVPASPILTRITVNNRAFDVVVAVTKIGNTLILDRETGQPIFDFRLRRAPASRHINDHTAPYQPDLQTPEPLIDIAFSPAMITHVSEASRSFVEQQLSETGTIYGRFTPPELNKDLVTFGLHGGAEWHGASLAPGQGTLYVPENMIPWVIRVYLQAQPGYRLADVPDRAGAALYSNKCASCHLDSGNGVFESTGEAATRYVPAVHGYTLLHENKSLFQVKPFELRPAHKNVLVTQTDLDQLWSFFEVSDQALFEHGRPIVASHWRQLLDQDRLPGSAPPWGKIVALNLSTGAKLWEVPLGEKIINGKPANTGSPSYGGLVATAGGLIFVVGTDDGFIRALDAASGETRWRYRMSAAGSAPPTTFEVNGKQYVCVVVTGGRFHNFVDKANKLYIFAL
jgi:quinoprotein glucose dehydrogenase